MPVCVCAVVVFVATTVGCDEVIVLRAVAPKTDEGEQCTEIKTCLQGRG